MGIFNLINKVTLGELSNYGPCLTTFNGSLALAWFGTDGRFNLLLSSDGVIWSDKQTVAFAVGDKNNVGPPALGAGGSLPYPDQFVAWRNSDNNALCQAINFPGTLGGELKPVNTQITPLVCLRATLRGLDRVIHS
jgi:hypothetical protein